MQPRHGLFALAIALGGLLFCAPVALAQCADSQVDLRSPDGGVVRFAVELADEPAERSRGLMFRETMSRSAGMLFVYEAPQRVSFWMKNTLLPLDMIFADARGVVRRVHGNAVPGDLTLIDGGPDVLLVLEINAGLAAALGIVAGSELRHPALGAGAAWPCE